MSTHHDYLRRLYGTFALVVILVLSLIVFLFLFVRYVK